MGFGGSEQKCHPREPVLMPLSVAHEKIKKTAARRTSSGNEVFLSMTPCTQAYQEMKERFRFRITEVTAECEQCDKGFHPSLLY